MKLVRTLHIHTITLQNDLKIRYTVGTVQILYFSEPETPTTEFTMSAARIQFQTLARCLIPMPMQFSRS